MPIFSPLGADFPNMTRPRATLKDQMIFNKVPKLRQELGVPPGVPLLLNPQAGLPQPPPMGTAPVSPLGGNYVPGPGGVPQAKTGYGPAPRPPDPRSLFQRMLGVAPPEPQSTAEWVQFLRQWGI